MSSSTLDSRSITSASPLPSPTPRPLTPKRLRPDTTTCPAPARETSPTPSSASSSSAYLNRPTAGRPLRTNHQMNDPANSLTKLCLPPLPHIDLPDLPPIHDEQLLQQVFTHSSYLSRPRVGVDFWALEEESWDNEKLEFVGDGLLGAVINRLLHSLWPNMQQGASTVLKSHLVNNLTLSQISIRYGLPTHLRTEISQKYMLQRGEKSTANLFEAYIAGVHESFLRHGPDPTSSPPPASPRIVFPKSGFGVTDRQRRPGETPNVDEQPPHIGSEGDAFEHITKWLQPLFRPIAIWALSVLQQEQVRLAELNTSSEPGGVTDVHVLGAAAVLNEWFIAKEGGCPSYEDCERIGDLWKVRVVATMKDGSIKTAEATKKTKKLASANAAFAICREMELIKL